MTPHRPRSLNDHRSLLVRGQFVGPQHTILTPTHKVGTVWGFRANQLKPIIDRSFNLEEVAEAHRYMESNSNFGKIVLKIS